MGFAGRSLATGVFFGLFMGLAQQVWAIAFFVVTPLPGMLAAKWFFSGLLQAVGLGLVMAADLQTERHLNESLSSSRADSCGPICAKRSRVESRRCKRWRVREPFSAWLRSHFSLPSPARKRALRHPSPTPTVFSAQTLQELKQLQQAAMASDYAYRQVAHLCNNIGPRLSGSSQAQKAVEYVAAELKALGLEVRLEKSWCRIGCVAKKSPRWFQFPGQARYHAEDCAHGVGRKCRDRGGGIDCRRCRGARL